MKNQQNAARTRRLRFLLILPALIIPFLTLMFWALDGGSADAKAPGEKQKVGINNTLPGANLKDQSSLDKMSFYDQAAKDSAERSALIRHDPGYRPSDTGYLPMAVGQAFNTGMTQLPPAGLNPYQPGSNTSSYESRISQRLEQLNQTINQPPTAPDVSTKYDPSTALQERDVARLEQLMKQMQGGSGSADPEMEQLNGMLEKILDIQNPDRAKEKLKESSAANKGKVYSVTTGSKRDVFTSLDKDMQQQENKQQQGFYSLDISREQTEDQNAVEAVVHASQTLVNGSTVKLRLLGDIYINGVLIPKDNFVYGIATLEGERLSIRIDAIRYKKSVYPVKLSIIDIDGIDGIYIPGAISRDVAKQSADRGIQDLSFGTMSNSIGVQAAGAGIEAAKSLFSKKVKLIKVTVKAGYRVLLRDEKQKQEN